MQRDCPVFRCPCVCSEWNFLRTRPILKDISGRREKNSYKITKIRMLIDFHVDL